MCFWYQGARTRVEEPVDVPPAGEDLQHKCGTPHHSWLSVFFWGGGWGASPLRGFRPGAKSPGGGARIGPGRPGPLGGPGTGRATGAGAAAAGEAGAAEAGVVAGGAGAEDFLAKPFRPQSDAINKESADVLHRSALKRKGPNQKDPTNENLPRPWLAAESC